MSHINSPIGSANLAFFSQCPVTEFLTCVKASCFSIQVNQLEILAFFKNNLLRLKTEVDTCINEIIGQELFLKNEQAVSMDNNYVSSPISSEVNAEKDRNIVIHGLDDADLLDDTKSLTCIRQFFEQKLRVNIEIKAVHVKRKRKSDKFVTVVELYSKKDKRKIFSNCHLLKNYGKKISVTDDLTTQQKIAKRKRLDSNEDETSTVSNIEIEERQASSSNQNCEDKASKLTEQDIQALKQVLNSAFEDSLARSGSKRNGIKLNSSTSNKNRKISYLCDMWRNFTRKVTEEGKTYNLNEHAVMKIIEMHKLYNQEQIRNKCICLEFCHLPWKEMSEKIGQPIHKKFAKKYKSAIKSMQENWNAEHCNDDDDDCFCKKIYIHAEDC
ncbi:unnamed protein product [Orchesella dallaii]|uniref:Uncharacterized protein n=1 Tax=Orchesella dallaii TaxID=48710 RepID=A0ABP1RKD4_9HEXA